MTDLEYGVSLLVQTGVIGICGRWPLAAPLLFGSRLAVLGGGEANRNKLKLKEKKRKTERVLVIKEKWGGHDSTSCGGGG